MKDIACFVLFAVFVVQMSLAQENYEFTELWEPEPEKVTPGLLDQPPSNAIILFNGQDLSNFVSSDGSKAEWDISDDYMTVNPSAKSIKTIQKFGDCQLHIEWRTPINDQDSGQWKGNSGIFLMERYEIQILDSWKNKTYTNGQAASIYKQYIPLVNACKKPGQWQSFDIIFTAPRFGKSGSIISPAKLTVLHNGVLVHNHVSLLGPTEFIGMPVYKLHEDKESIMIQNHGDLVSFRNIWIREL